MHSFMLTCLNQHNTAVTEWSKTGLVELAQVLMAPALAPKQGFQNFLAPTPDPRAGYFS